MGAPSLSGQHAVASAPPGSLQPPAGGAGIVAPEAAFTVDGRCVAMGCGDGTVRCYATVQNGATPAGGECAAWRGHSGVPSCLRFSPRRAMAASGCSQGGLALWIPAAVGG